MKKNIFIFVLEWLLFKYYFELTFSYGQVKIYRLKHELNLPVYSIFYLLSKDTSLDNVCIPKVRISSICEEFPERFTDVCYVLLKADDRYNLVGAKGGKFVFYSTDHPRIHQGDKIAIL